MKAILISSALACLLYTALSVSPALATQRYDAVAMRMANPDIVEAAAGFMRVNTDYEILRSAKQSFEIVAVVGEYAVLRETTVPRVSDTLTIYMKLERGRWFCIGAGTGFLPNELRNLGVPSPLWSR